MCIGTLIFADAKLPKIQLNKGKNSNNWKIARDGCVVVMTNLDVAMDVINLEFK